VTPTGCLTFYAYNEASRAPTVIELGCANPAAPCGLPMTSPSDPISTGGRSNVEAGLRASTPDNDWCGVRMCSTPNPMTSICRHRPIKVILKNVGNTRRQGVTCRWAARQAA